MLVKPVSIVSPFGFLPYLNWSEIGPLPVPSGMINATRILVCVPMVRHYEWYLRTLVTTCGRAFSNEYEMRQYLPKQMKILLSIVVRRGVLVVR